MWHMPDEPVLLPYGRRPPAPPHPALAFVLAIVELVLRSRWLRYSILPLVIVIGYLLMYGMGPTSGDIRLDSGDLRYRYFGIPIIYERMPEPERSRLIKLTSKSSICRNEWHQCVVYPLRGSNNPDWMCRGFYWRIVKWIDVDPELALAGVDDVGRYIIDTHARQGLPKSMPLISGFTFDNNGGIRADWREDEGVKYYLESRGLTATRPASRPDAEKP